MFQRSHVIAERSGDEAKVDPSGFNQLLELPYSLRLVDFEIAMQDVYDLFRDINGLPLERGLRSGWVYKAGVPLPLHHTRSSSD